MRQIYLIFICMPLSLVYHVYLLFILPPYIKTISPFQFQQNIFIFIYLFIHLIQFGSGEGHCSEEGRTFWNGFLFLFENDILPFTLPSLTSLTLPHTTHTHFLLTHSLTPLTPHTPALTHAHHLPSHFPSHFSFSSPIQIHSHAIPLIHSVITNRTKWKKKLFLVHARAFTARFSFCLFCGLVRTLPRMVCCAAGLTFVFAFCHAARRAFVPFAGGSPRVLLNRNIYISPLPATMATTITVYMTFNSHNAQPLFIQIEPSQT